MGGKHASLSTGYGMVTESPTKAATASARPVTAEVTDGQAKPLSVLTCVYNYLVYLVRGKMKSGEAGGQGGVEHEPKWLHVYHIDTTLR